MDTMGLPEVLVQDDPALHADDIEWAPREMVVGCYQTVYPQDELRAMLARWAELTGGEVTWMDWLEAGEMRATLPGGRKVLINGRAVQVKNAWDF